MSNPIATTASAAPSTSPVVSRPHDAWAEVRAHDHVMRYRRSGTGRAVLVLDGAGGAATLWPELADALAAGFRAIVPDVPDDESSVAAWLTDFLEGLGMASIAVVAADQLCIPALELALLDADQVARLVLVPRGEAQETGLDGALATRTGNESVPLLVVRRGMAASDAVPLVTRFLSGDQAGGAAY